MLSPRPGQEEGSSTHEVMKISMQIYQRKLQQLQRTYRAKPVKYVMYKKWQDEGSSTYEVWTFQCRSSKKTSNIPAKG